MAKAPDSKIPRLPPPGVDDRPGRLPPVTYIKPPVVNSTLPNPVTLRSTSADTTVERNLILRTAKPGEPEPYVYGYTAVRPMVIAADDSGEYLVLDLLWSRGEIEEIEGPYLYIPDIGVVNVPSGSPLLHEHFLGTEGQSASTIMTGLKGSYAAYPGRAHSVVSMTNPKWNLNLMGFIKGRKLIDPRIGTSPPARTYSANPALILADVLSLCGFTLDWPSVTAAANYCDEGTGTNSPADKRWQIGMVINERRDLQQWIQALAAYCQCFVDIRGGTAFLIPDKPRASNHTITAADMIEGSCRVNYRSKRDAPGAVTVVFKAYTDTTFSTTYPDPAGSSPTAVLDPGAVSQLNMPGWSDFGRAKRYAEEVWRKSQLPRTVEFSTFDKGLLYTIGDVGTITNAAYGLNSDTFILTKTEQTERGRWKLTYGQEYAATSYSEEQYSDSPVSTDLFNPFYPPPGPTPTLSFDTVTADSPNWQRIKIEFAPRFWAYLQDYKVTVHTTADPTTILYTEYVAKGSETGSPLTITTYTDFATDFTGSPQNVYQVNVYIRSIVVDWEGNEVLGDPGSATIDNSYITTAKQLGGQTSSPISDYYMLDNLASPVTYNALIPATGPTDYLQDFTLVFSLYVVTEPGLFAVDPIFYSFATGQGYFVICSGGNGKQFDMKAYDQDGTFVFCTSQDYQLSPGQRFWEAGSWISVMIAHDSQATSPENNVVKIYRNGVEVSTYNGVVGGPGSFQYSTGGSPQYAQGRSSLKPMGLNCNAYVGVDKSAAGTYAGMDCYISHVWCKSEYLDPATNWSKFFDGDNKPIDLGADGSGPTGAAPESFFPDGDFTNNRGTGPNWTEVGTVPDAPISPTD